MSNPELTNWSTNDISIMYLYYSINVLFNWFILLFIHLTGCTNHIPNRPWIFRPQPTITILREPVSRLLSAWFYRGHSPNLDFFQVRPYFKDIEQGKRPKGTSWHTPNTPSWLAEVNGTSTGGHEKTSSSSTNQRNNNNDRDHHNHANDAHSSNNISK